MNYLLNTFKQGTEFGKFHKKENFFSFLLKCIFYIIPAVLIGNYLDIFILKIKKKKILGNKLFNYILLQSFLNIIILYFILFLLFKYSSEFQVTIEGGFFSVLYFGTQTNYIYMIKKFLNN